jgi:hypothetical protein
MNQVDLGREEPDDEMLSQVSTFESLMIQALINQLTDIVQGKGKKVSYDNQLKQAQTLQLLTQSALMLTDSETIFLEGWKLQDFFNRVFLEHTLAAKSHDRTIPKSNNASRASSETIGDESGEGE